MTVPRKEKYSSASSHVIIRNLLVIGRARVRVIYQNLSYLQLQFSQVFNALVSMKRKLNEADIPAEVEGEAVNKSASSFSSLGLDARLCQAVAKHNFSTPTPVQSKGIPLALAGKDILGMFKRPKTPDIGLIAFKLARRPARARQQHTSFRSYNQFWIKRQWVAQTPKL